MFSHFSAEVKLSSPDWFIDWGTTLWLHSRSLNKAVDADDESEEEKSAEFEKHRRLMNEQYDTYLAGHWPYESINQKVIAARPPCMHVLERSELRLMSSLLGVDCRKFQLLKVSSSP